MQIFLRCYQKWIFVKQKLFHISFCVRSYNNTQSSEEANNGENLKQDRAIKNLQTVLDKFVRRDVEKISINGRKEKKDADGSDVVIDDSRQSLDKKSIVVTNKLRLRKRKTHVNIDLDEIPNENYENVGDLTEIESRWEESDQKENIPVTIPDNQSKVDDPIDSVRYQSSKENYLSNSLKEQHKPPSFSDSEDFSDVPKPIKRKKPLKTYANNKRTRISQRISSLSKANAELPSISISNDGYDDSRPAVKNSLTMDVLMKTKEKSVVKMKDIVNVTKCVDETVVEDDRASDAAVLPDVR